MKSNSMVQRTPPCMPELGWGALASDSVKAAGFYPVIVRKVWLWRMWASNAQPFALPLPGAPDAVLAHTFRTATG